MKTKTQKCKVAIHDVKTGVWELATLEQPLLNSYNPGFTSIIPVKRNVLVNSVQFHEYVLFSAPRPIEYIKIGLKKMWMNWKISRIGEK